MRARPTISPICHGRGTRCWSTSKSGRSPEVALAPRCEADVAADPRDLERPHRVALEIVADDVPVPVVEPERVRIDRSLARSGAPRAPVAEPHRALLRDRRLELREPSGELRRVVGSADPDALGRLGRRLRKAGPAEREVLEREAQRLGVRELPLEVVQAPSAAPRARRRRGRGARGSSARSEACTAPRP